MALGVGCVLAGRARARQVIGSASVGNGHGPNSGCPLRGASAAAAAESCAVLLEEVSGQLSCTTGQDSTASCCWVDGRSGSGSGTGRGLTWLGEPRCCGRE